MKFRTVLKIEFTARHVNSKRLKVLHLEFRQFNTAFPN